MNGARQRRRVLVALAVSLLFNVFLLGFLAARLGVGRMVGPENRSSGRQVSTRHPGDHPMRRILAGQREHLRASRAQVRQARAGVRDALLAEPFVPRALDAAFVGLRTATGQAQQALHRALLEAAPSLSSEERARLSRAHRLWSGGGRRRGRLRTPRHQGP